jgi:epoxyqueuosine reductase
MTLNNIVKKFESEFDLVGVIHKDTYNQAAKSRGKNQINKGYQTLIVLGYAYPKRTIKPTNTYLVPSFYTFGKDYHLVMKDKIISICDHIPYPYEFGVDNHDLDERLMAELAGLGFKGKNQLIINKELGSYFFLGYVLIDVEFSQPYVKKIVDSCGLCRQCIDACPTQALTDKGYIMSRCISYYNQEKMPLSIQQIKTNYQLFGCDICQLVCPKNIGKGHVEHPEFHLNRKEKVQISDLYHLSQKAFTEKYKDMAYLWKGKTILMRNASMVLLNNLNTNYIQEIEKSLEKHRMPWYQETTKLILEAFKKIESR